MTQTVAVEMDDGVELDTDTTSQLRAILDHVSDSDGVSRLRLEIEVEDQIGLPLQLTTENGNSETQVEKTDTLEIDQEEVDEKDPRLNPDTRRWTLASMLYHSTEPLQVSEIIELSQGEEWEMTQSQASAELYGMYNDGLTEREGSPYEYQLTETGEEKLEEDEAEITPNPF